MKQTRRDFVRSSVAAGVLGGAPIAARSAQRSNFDWKKYKGTQLHFMVSTFPWNKYVKAHLAEFTDATGISVEWEQIYEDQLRQKLPLLLHTDPESVDGFGTLPSWDAQSFSEAGWYEPLEKYIHSELTSPDYDFADFFPNALNIARVKGTQIGIPLVLELQILYYNKALLRAKHIAVPRTTQELLAAAKALNDPGRGVAGFVSRGAGAEAVYTLSPYLFTFGGRWTGANGKPDLNSKAFLDALTFYGDILHSAGPPNIAGMQWKTTRPLFEQGRAAMMTDGSNWVGYMLDPSESKIVNDVGFSVLPTGPSGLHSTLISWALAINPRSRHKEAAWYFIQWFTSKDQFAKATPIVKLPSPRRSIFETIYQQQAPADYRDTIRREIGSAVPNGANPLVVQVAEVRAAIGQAIVSALQGGDPKAAAQNAQQTVATIVAER